MANRKLSVLARLAGAVLLACALPASAFIPRDDTPHLPVTHHVSLVADDVNGKKILGQEDSGDQDNRETREIREKGS